MKKVKKILLLLGLLIGIFACSTLPTESDDLETSQGKGSVNFALSGVSSTNSNILFSTATNSEDTPKRVSISYRKSGATSEATNSMELSAFGSSFVLADPISLEAGDYEVTKFDVLSSSGKTIYSTPMTGSVIDNFLNISTSLAYAFTVTAGESKEINMQVVGVNEDSKASDFGRDAFTYELITYSEFYIAAYLQDEEYALTATPATLTIKNPSGTTITNKNLLAEKNRILVADYDSYTFIVSKDSLTKSFTISKSELAKYKKEALKVIFFATPHAYKLINKNMTWSEAKAYCEGLDGYLVTITSQEEQKYIFDSILAPNNYPGCWAGGTDRETEDTWKWITGEDWTYSNWTYGEPNNEKNNENYLHLGLNPNNNKWNDYVGSYALYFICEWNSEADMLSACYNIIYDANGGSGSVPSVATTKLDEVTIASGSNLSKAGYTFIGWSTNSSATSITYTTGQKVKFTSSTTLYAVWKNNSLYKFINEKMTWSEAKAYCENLGGHLVTIASQEENNYIAENILVPNGAPGCWAGGTDRETEDTWKWVTGEAWTYNNWAVGEPNNWGDEDYLQIFGSNCNWNDGYETTLLPFICEWENEVDIIDTTFRKAEWFLVEGELGIQRRSDWWDSLEEQWKKAFNSYKVLNLGYDNTTKPSDENIQRIFNKTEIDVCWCRLTNFSGLKHLTNLTTLYCYENKLSSLTGLENCPNLTTLSCGSNQLSSLTGLKNCPNLTNLSCDRNQLSSLTGLENLTNLTSLNCQNNQLSSLTGLENLTKLSQLYCYNNQLSSLKGLENCTNLYRLYCYYNQLSSLTGLENCTNLTYLHCRNNQLKSLKGLENCPNLTELSCGSNQLSSLTGIENCSNLTNLSCDRNQLSSLTGLENCTNLTSLSCDYNQISSLTGLKNCPNLATLTCSYNQLSSLTGIENCTNLTHLNCWNNQLSSLTGLENCTKLSTLDCYNNQLSSLTGIENCTNLTYLYCYSNQISNEEVVRIKGIIPNCNIRNNGY